MAQLQLSLHQSKQAVTVFYRQTDFELFKPLLVLSPIEAHRLATQLRLNADACYLDPIEVGLFS